MMDGVRAERVRIFLAIDRERERQDRLWGEQNHPIIRPEEAPFHVRFETDAKKNCDEHAAKGDLSWYDIATEEFAEIFGSERIEDQQRECIHLAAVVVSMYERLERLKKERATRETTA